jgi:hypothetical protein
MTRMAAARATLSSDTHAPVRVHAKQAVVVRFADAGVAEGCEVHSR